MVLSVLGAAVPMLFFYRYMQETGAGPLGLMQPWWSNDSVTGLAADLAIASAVFIVWVIHGATSTRDWLRLLAIPATLLIGLSCGLPLYLYLRTRPRY